MRYHPCIEPKHGIVLDCACGSVMASSASDAGHSEKSIREKRSFNYKSAL